MHFRPCFLLIAASVLLPICAHAQQPQDAGLEIELIASPNFVVDSSIATPSGKSLQAPHRETVDGLGKIAETKANAANQAERAPVLGAEGGLKV